MTPDNSDSGQLLPTLEDFRWLHTASVDSRCLLITPDNSRRLLMTTDNSSRLLMTQDNSDSGQQRPTLDDFRWLHTTSVDSGQLQTTLDDSGWLRLQSTPGDSGWPPCDSERLLMIPTVDDPDSGRLWTILDNFKRFQTAPNNVGFIRPEIFGVAMESIRDFGQPYKSLVLNQPCLSLVVRYLPALCDSNRHCSWNPELFMSAGELNITTPHFNVTIRSSAVFMQTAFDYKRTTPRELFEGLYY